MRIHSFSQPTRRLALMVSLFALLLNACSLSLLDIPGLNAPLDTTPQSPGENQTPTLSAAITFQVVLPAPLQTGETLFLSVVDEVTGLAWNTTDYPMQGMDSQHFAVTIPFPLNSIVKYRYLRQGVLPVFEDDSFDKPVRYRMYHVTGLGSVDDVIASWGDSLFSSPSGRMSGQVTDSSSNTPMPDILISAGGQQTLTDSSGSFLIDDLPVGTHNLVAYSLDGNYQTFQQGARVEADQMTPVAFSLLPARMVNVNFIVSVPANTIPNIPIRMAGNLYQLGNTFGDLQGGLSSVASRMPTLSPLQDGRFNLSMMLPAGAEIRYKYTIGDGFWNAEHGVDESFILRQLIIPDTTDPVQVEDSIQTWQAGQYSPILFELTVPANTPVTDIVSIQFNPYGWTEPLPMWPRGNNQWVYQLYSPLNMLGEFEYRYCRNDQCGSADDLQTSAGRPGRAISTSLLPQDLQDTVSGWNWLENSTPSSLVGLPVTARQGFMAGVEFQPGYDPTWQAWTTLAIQNAQGLFANWLVLCPSWTIERNAPYSFTPIPGKDPLWLDSLDTINRARAANMNVAIFPSADTAAGLDMLWQSAPRDETWWKRWFERYSAFAVYNADLAARSGAQVLILGGDWVTPALPGGQVAGGGSGVPADAASRWQSIINDVRAHFAGSIFWAVPYKGGTLSLPDFVQSLDGIYLLWTVPLNGSGAGEIATLAGQVLDDTVFPVVSSLQKPAILAVSYASTDGSASAALPDSLLFQPGATQVPVNLLAQADVYLGLLSAVNGREWLGGFVSRGYNPPVMLQDASASVRGKPAADLLWYWFPRLLGVVQ